MNIKTTFEDNIRSVKPGRGAYEWWYFDAISDDDSVEIVVIFYDGNPFSRRYIQQLRDDSSTVSADNFPAISISVYKDCKPVYYSFTEVDKTNAFFSKNKPGLRIAEHSMSGYKEKDKTIFKITLKEQLPSGDAISGTLTFRSPDISSQLFRANENKTQKHHWNLVQPNAKVSGKLRWSARDESSTSIVFKGKGYHDHNIGSEPLKNQFNNWYWGRFHFENSTLIYYTTGIEDEAPLGWLIENENKNIITTFNEAKFEAVERNIWGLSSARKITLSGDKMQVMVQQTRILDNGPFYQRFSSDAFLNDLEFNSVQKTTGMTEYLCPPRIYNRLYWPFTNMRIRYQKESPHWVQRFKMFYRWTW